MVGVGVLVGVGVGVWVGVKVGVMVEVGVGTVQQDEKEGLAIQASSN